jgi:hypothetical protein
MKYEEIQQMSAEQIDSIILRNQPDELLIAVLSAALYADDVKWAEDVCAKLANHENDNVRGNAILGFGHIARIHGKLTESKVRPLVEAALRDNSKYVRGHADAAADDIAHFLGWNFDR